PAGVVHRTRRRSDGRSPGRTALHAVAPGARRQETDRPRRAGARLVPDLVHGPSAEWGNLTCGCHPNCGVGMAVMIDKETKEAVPVTAFLHAQAVAED